MESPGVINLLICFSNKMSSDGSTIIDFDGTWHDFVTERMENLYEMTKNLSFFKQSKLDKIILDGEKISHCCDNFMEPTCCKANKKLRELNFQPESNVEYHFI